MGFRLEHDTMGEIAVPQERAWGAQTQRSLQHFAIGSERMPEEVIRAFAILKSAAATTNGELGKLSPEKQQVIEAVCAEVLAGLHDEEFPLKVWQTGSGTQSNMNVNEVIAHLGNRRQPELCLHPNDDINMSQSSNDTFPTAMHIAAAVAVAESLLPAIERLRRTMERLEAENHEVIKIGRTHLQDAVPLRFSQEISGWRGMLEATQSMIETAVHELQVLAIGGTAVGTGLNCPVGFDSRCAKQISTLTGFEFTAAENKFHALTAKDGYVFLHGALKALAANLMKIANDVRWLASGPRCGIGEITIPENEPGSSIMPGKVNPTQCEALTMIAVQVMGNDATIGIAASQGNFELNVFMPVMAYNMLQSIRLLADGMTSFDEHCLSGLRAVPEKMRHNLEQSLMLVTCLTPQIGYEKAALAAKKAFADNTTLKEAVIALGYLSEAEYDQQVRPEKMV